MVAVGKEGKPHVGEDKIFGQKVDQFKDLLGPPARLNGEIDVRVVRLHDATEENSDNT